MKLSTLTFKATLVLSLAAANVWAAISDTPDSGVWGVEGGIVYAIVRHGSVVYIGGDFTSLVSPDGSTTRSANGLAALDASTGDPTNWRPAADGTVLALAAASDGSAIYAGGTFSTIDGVGRSRFAAIGPDGSLLWSADAGSIVKAIVVSGDTIYLGGNFSKVLGTSRLRLAAIQPPSRGTQGVLLSWNPSITSNDGTTPSVIGLAVANGDVVASGNFTTANGQSSPNQARFDAVSGALKSWSTPIVVAAKDLATDGINYYGAFGGSGGRLVAWGPTGHDLWTAKGNGDMQAVAFCDGKVIVGGHFTTILSTDIPRLAALSPAGALDTSWAPSPNSGGDLGVWVIYAASDKLYVGGGFGQIGTHRARGFAQFSISGGGGGGGDVQSPTAPSQLVASASSSSRVDLRWKASTDNVGVTGYAIYRASHVIANVGAVTNASDTTVAAGNTYSYQVVARDAAGNVSDPSNTATVTTPSSTGDTQPPTAPTGLSGNAVSSTRIDLDWNPSTDNVAVTGYQVYRDSHLLATIGTTTSYSDGTCKANTFYSYQVRARDAQNNVSAASSTVRVKSKSH